MGVLVWTLAYVVADGGARGGFQPFLALCVTSLVVLVATTLWARRNVPSTAFVAVQLALDVALATSLAALTGGRESFFIFLYVPAIAAGAWLLRLPGALGTAAATTVAMLGMLAVRGDLTPTDADHQLFLYLEAMFRVFAFFLIAILTGQLAESVERAGRALEAQQRTTLALATEHGTVLDRVRAGVVTTDATGRIVALNPFARRLLGEVAARPVSEIFHRPEGREAWEELRPDGQRWVCSVAPLPDGGQVVVVDDITEMARMRERAARDERLVEAGRLAASLAHEVRNPLAGLSGALQMIREEHPSRLADLALGEAERLNRLVEDFLAAPGNPRLRRVPVDLRALGADVCEAFARDPRYAGAVDAYVEGDPVVVSADADRLRQALWNLVLNGAQAMPRGGLIRVRIDAAPPDGAEIRVSDEGVGITTRERDRVFDPFYTRRSGGTGLGLALVDQVVRAHGGTIRVEPGASEGTAFVVWLPLESTVGA